jgi:hypothetical protein
VGAAVRAADPIDRIQGREHDQQRGCEDPSHEPIITCFRWNWRLGLGAVRPCGPSLTLATGSLDDGPCPQGFEQMGARTAWNRSRVKEGGSWPPRFDSVPVVEHPRDVVRLVQRLAALALTFGLMAGNAAICRGWMPTPEARMACCAEGGECPMHEGDSHRSGSERGLTQAQADSCCASSERENSDQSNPSSVTAITGAVLGVGVVLPASVPALVLSDAWRTSAPISIAPVPKHVLLSVFLV